MRSAITTLSLLIIATFAGFTADQLSLPLPYMLGPLLASGIIATALPHHLPKGYLFPPWLRFGFIAIIGLMIGAQVTPDLFASTGRLVLSVTALGLFVILAFAGNFLIFTRLGQYDRVTAFYASSPGGLFESIAMGEAAGADATRLMLQQFLRIIVVVTALPFGLSFWLGEPVGSAGGMSFASADVPLWDLPVIALIAAAGAIFGQITRLPAKQLTGPMVIAAIVTLSGIWPIDLPQWLVNVAQIVVGTALGMRFTGLSRALVLRGMALSFVSVGVMLVISAAFALCLQSLTGETFDALLVSFAPGGVTEMSLVALSLNTNAAFVTLHHVIRILLTVIILIITTKWVDKGFDKR